MMKKYNFGFIKIYILTLVIIGLLAGWCFVNFKKPTFVIVDTDRVLASSSLSEQEQARMNAVLDSVRNSEQEAESLYATLSADEARETKMVDQQILRQVIEKNRQLARQATMLEINRAVKNVITAKDYPLAVDSSLVLTNDQSLDITDQVIEALSATEVNFGPLPEIKVTRSEEE